jgi:hypothetical protein
MKKLYLVTALVLVLIAGAGNSEMLFAQGIRLGARGGLSIPSLQGGNTEQSKGYKSRLGPDFGFFTDLVFTHHFSLEIELLYVGQGGVKKGIQSIPAGSLSGSGLPVPTDMTLYANFKNESILNYAEIPFLAKYSFDAGKSFRIYIDGGPNLGILVSARTKSSGLSLIYSDNLGTPLTIGGQPLPPVDFGGETSIKSDVHTLNFGIAGGLGISRSLGPGEISLNGRGSYGLTNIQKGTDNGDNRTGCLVIALGYSVKI